MIIWKPTGNLFPLVHPHIVRGNLNITHKIFAVKTLYTHLLTYREYSILCSIRLTSIKHKN